MDASQRDQLRARQQQSRQETADREYEKAIWRGRLVRRKMIRDRFIDHDDLAEHPGLITEFIGSQGFWLDGVARRVFPRRARGRAPGRT